MRSIGLGDAARALAGRPDDEHARILGMLGLRFRDRDDVAPADGAASGLPARTQPPPAPRRRPKETPPKPAAEPSGKNDALVLRESAAATMPAWFADVQPLAAERGGEDVRPAAPAPLFTPVWQRRILVAALSTAASALELDVDAAVDKLGRGEALERIPAAERRSLQAGAQIIVDVSEPMRPFFADQSQMLAVAETIFARERLDLVYCDRGPPYLRGKGRYVAPPRGVTVLILSNFGITSRSLNASHGSARAWAAFASALRAGGRAAIAFSPLDAELVPASLRRVLPVVPWDRTTGTALVSRARSRASALSHG